MSRDSEFVGNVTDLLVIHLISRISNLKYFEVIVDENLIFSPYFNIVTTKCENPFINSLEFNAMLEGWFIRRGVYSTKVYYFRYCMHIVPLPKSTKVVSINNEENMC